MTDDAHELRRALERMERRQYGAYKDLRGRRFALGPLTLRFDHIQGDPFAAPSRLRIDVDAGVARLPESRAAADFLHRDVWSALRSVRGGRGSGKSGRVEIASVGQEVLERTGVVVRADGGATLRITVGLPAQGRRILGYEAAELLIERIPDAVERVFERLDRDALEAHIHAVADQVALREALDAAGLVAFVADGSVLPRRSGVDDRPMHDAVEFSAPEGLAVELEAPHAGRLRGMGVPRGVTLVVGGGYHGKSTLLTALARGVYDHVPGDGRDRCVTVDGAVCIRAEDGRAIRGVDLRPFIGDLPRGRSTEAFETDDASGSTSQAAAIVEALEAGATALLVDEDTAATNFMVRDARMRRLVPEASEPITPFIDRVRQLHESRGVSTVLVVGGAGDYLDVADAVVRMDAYVPHDATERAREVAAELPLQTFGDVGPWPDRAPRIPDPRGLDPRKGKRHERVRSVRTRSIEFGTEEIDVALVAQLVDPAQARAIGDALLQLSRGLCDGERSIEALLDALDEVPLERLAEPTFGDRARPRRHEIAAALNRLRSLRIRAGD